MKRVKIKNKEFKVIPEARLVQGEMIEKSFENDLKMGIKNKCKSIIRHGMLVNDQNWPASLDTILHANAYCDEKDEWNEKIGIEVCAAKLDLKNHKKLAKQYGRLYRLLFETIDVVTELIEYHTKKAEAIEDDLVRTYGRMKV